MKYSAAASQDLTVLPLISRPLAAHASMSFSRSRPPSVSFAESYASVTGAGYSPSCFSISGIVGCTRAVFPALVLDFDLVLETSEPDEAEDLDFGFLDAGSESSPGALRPCWWLRC